ncbi:G5P family DNA-binding protein [Schlegelella sp. S2-27]|uniref:Single-stranded DNA-binding protein n=1 Tax=Caldimonas mangrovi TaxID=2944811 RepID=A0ABT0YT38_9BURK|nr:G5P family DNA-binding protein [Caldimonas mangrovi]MCM5681908.1 G5P family DNA-binding protein [Caldimonas mangrovi]
MPIKIIIAQTGVRNVKGTSAKGKAYDMNFQTGYAVTVDKDGNSPPFPEKFDFVLDSGAPPYAVGEYTLHPSAVYIDQNGRLAVAPRLVPLKKA